SAPNTSSVSNASSARSSCKARSISRTRRDSSAARHGVACCFELGYKCSRNENMSALTSHLLGNTRTAVLGALLLRPDDRLHVRELARVTGISAGTLHRELTALASLDVLTRRVEGRQVYYAANRMNPVFEELAGLLRKTAGLVDVLRDSLIPYRDRIAAAFVYGSLAAGTESARSDVDLMIVGDIGFAE